MISIDLTTVSNHIELEELKLRNTEVAASRLKNKNEALSMSISSRMRMKSYAKQCHRKDDDERKERCLEIDFIVDKGQRHSFVTRKKKTMKSISSVGTMNSRRKSTFPSLARPSTVSVYTTAVDFSDDDDQDENRLSNPFLRLFWYFYIHKSDIYHILERQEGRRTLVYHLGVFALTLISLVFGGISTINEWRPTLDTPLYYGELGLCIFFTYEFILRLWSAGAIPKYRTWVGRLMFVSRPVIILDLLTLLGFALALATGIRTGEFPNLALKFLPPLQMIRFLRVDRQLTSWRVLKDIILKHRQELTVTLVIGFMFLVTGAYLVHIAETPMDPKSTEKGPYRSMADSMWFAIITMTTIGFGDLYPSTFIAKMVTTTICFLGVAFWCLPAGIIGSGLAIQVQEQKRDEAFNRLVPAAASVIRNWWRLRCASQGDRFVSTWKIYTLIQRRVNTFLPSSSTHIRRKSIDSINDLPPRYVTAIRIIRMLKYSAACKKFQQAKKPVDLKDVVKENTQMSHRVSSTLSEIQRRLDFGLGTIKTASFLSDERKHQLSLNARLDQIEIFTNQFQQKLEYLEELAFSLVERRIH